MHVRAAINLSTANIVHLYVQVREAAVASERWPTKDSPQLLRTISSLIRDAPALVTGVCA